MPVGILDGMEICGFRRTKRSKPCSKPIGPAGWCGTAGHPRRGSGGDSSGRAEARQAAAKQLRNGSLGSGHDNDSQLPSVEATSVDRPSLEATSRLAVSDDDSVDTGQSVESSAQARGEDWVSMKSRDRLARAEIAVWGEASDSPSDISRLHHDGLSDLIGSDDTHQMRTMIEYYEAYMEHYSDEQPECLWVCRDIISSTEAALETLTGSDG